MCIGFLVWFLGDGLPIDLLMKLARNPFKPKMRMTYVSHPDWKHRIAFHFQSIFQFLFLRQSWFQVKRKWNDFLKQMAFSWEHNSRYDFRTFEKQLFVSSLCLFRFLTLDSAIYPIWIVFFPKNFFLHLLLFLLDPLPFHSIVFIANWDNIRYRSI